jgi:N-acetylglucosaminyldiphosphoundecaprenol N-acetyl-beta-D-mannosaminyltransferase
MGADGPPRLAWRCGPVSDRCAVLLGAPVDDVTIPEAIDRIMGMVEVGRATGRVHQVATVNVDFLVNAAHDTALLTLLQRTDLAIPDGMPIVWGSRLVDTPLRQRTTGVDVLPALVERAAKAGVRVCLFGAAPGVAGRAAELLSERFARAHVVGLEAPFVGPDGAMDERHLEAIRAARPDIVGVALGNPKQEWWIDRHGPALGSPVLIGIGGTLDFLTGVTRRAPSWMQRTGLEWLHRAVSEPRRLAGRYARDFVVFGPGLLEQAWRGRRRAAAVVPLTSQADDSTVTIRLLGPIPAGDVEPTVGHALRAGQPIIIDVSGLGTYPLDNVTVATLAGLFRLGRRAGADIGLEGMTPRLRADARQLRVETLIFAPEANPR